MRRAVGIVSLMAGVCFWMGNAQAGQLQDKKPAPDAPKKEGGKATGHEGHAPGDHAGHDHGDHADMKPLQSLPEHKVLLEGVGKWKTETKHFMMPGADPTISPGTSVVTPILNGLGTAVDVESTGPMGTFKGYGIFTWNTTAKKYEGVWLDIFGFDGMDEFQGTYDAATKTFTWTYSMSMPGMPNTPCKIVEKHETPDKFTSVFTMTAPGQKEEVKMMEIAYTRMK